MSTGLRRIGHVGFAGLIVMVGWNAQAEDIGPINQQQRRQQAFQMRQDAALSERNAPWASHPDNGDEKRYATHIGSFAKALPHTALGQVDPSAYQALLDALASGRANRFEAIPMGGTVKLADPQAAYAYVLEGADSAQLKVRPAPTLASAEEAGEMVELYWQALTRDVAYSAYATDPLIAAAAADLSRLSDFRAPKTDGAVTPKTIFRGPRPGDLAGPYVSQFLLKDIPHGSTQIVQRYKTPVAGDDYLTGYDAWLKIQQGTPAPKSNAFDETPRYIRNSRDLSEYVHRDYTYQAFVDACLMLAGMKAPLDAGNPYVTSKTQSGFATFGAPDALDLTAHAANAALKAVWYQKWLVHRRLRPEEFGGLVHNAKIGAADAPINPELLISPVLQKVFAKYGTYLLPMAYPEGCPTHPAYPAGHAAIAGACVTILKAFFDESFVIPNPVVASDDGLTLVPYTGAPLTVGGELDKLASNISISRDAAGVHWRSDAVEGMNLGEQVAIALLKEMGPCVNERFKGFSLTKFDGTTIIIGAAQRRWIPRPKIRRGRGDTELEQDDEDTVMTIQAGPESTSPSFDDVTP